MTMKGNELLKPAEVADILQVSPRTLERWREENRGPSYVYIERQVRYPKAWLESYIRGWMQVAAGNADVPNPPDFKD